VKILSRRKWLSLLIAGVTVSGVVGAGGAVASAGSSPVTIQYWTNDTNPVEAQIVAAFNQSHPDITVKLTQYQTDTYLAALATGASNRSLPDVFFEGLGATLAHEYEDAGLIENLTPYAVQGDWAKKFSPLAIKLLTYKNKWWEEPLFDIGMGIWYRKDIFTKLHIGVPSSFAQFTTDLGIIKKAGYTPISLGGQDYWMPMRFFDGLLQYYGKNSFYTALADRKVSWDSPQVIEAFTTLRQWTEDDYFTPGFMSINPNNDYIPLFQGSATMVLEGPWEDATINSNKQPLADYGFFPFPADESPNLLSTFSQGIMIGANTKHLQAALTFMEYYDSTSNLEQFGSTLTQPDALLSVSPPASQPHARAIAALINKEGIGYLPTDQVLPQPLVNSFSKAQAGVITGTMTPTAAAKFLASAVASYKGPWPWGNQPVP
jgi:ABC-type glycerol-3-phosphate transport system substrate-binding protein